MPDRLADNSLKAILFDLDGTLVHSVPDLAAAANKLLAEEGLPPVNEEAVAKMVGDGVPKLVERAFAACDRPLSTDQLPAMAERYLGFYTGHEAELSHLFPGVEEMLHRLAARGLQLAVCTNKPEQPARQILSAYGLDRWIGHVIGGDSLVDDAGHPVRKPDGGMVRHLLETMGHGGEQAAFVGDSPNDVMAGRNGGVNRLVVVTFGYSRLPVESLGAHAVIDRFDDLDAALGLA